MAAMTFWSLALSASVRALLVLSNFGLETILLFRHRRLEVAYQPGQLQY
jgi:hypothetical protein